LDLRPVHLTRRRSNIKGGGVIGKVRTN